MALRLVSLLFLLLAAVIAIDHHSKPLHLSDRNFEHDTQAASGQTTGTWLVLFTGPDSAQCKLAEDAVSQVLAGLQGHPLVAKVDLSQSPKTAKRFQMTDPPYLKLFRDRLVFSYSGDWSVASISQFADEGWKQVTGDKVPAEIGFTVSDLVKILQQLTKYPGMLIGLLVTIGATILVSYKKRKVPAVIKPSKKKK